MKHQHLNKKTYNQQRAVRLAKWVIQYRWLVVGITLGVLIATGYGARFLGFNSDYNAFFGEENPQLQAMDALQNKYTSDKNIFIGIAPQDGNVFTKNTLAAIEELVTKLWQTPHSSRVDALTNFQYTRAEGDDLFVGDLVEQAADKTTAELANIRAIALQDLSLIHI